MTHQPHKIVKIILILTFLIVSSHAIGKETELEGPPSQKRDTRTIELTLDECVAHAIKNSDQLAAERHRMVALTAQKKSLLWEPFSHFYLQGKFTMVPDKCVQLDYDGMTNCDGTLPVTGDENYSNTNWGPSFHIKLAGAIPIPTSKKMSAGKTALEEGIKAKEAMIPSFQHEIRYNVHRAFHAITGAREMLYTLSEGRKHIIKAREKIEENLKNEEGSETEIDLVKIKVFEAQLDAMEQEAILIEQQGLAALNFLVNLDGKRRVDIPETPQKIVDGDLKTLKDYKQAAIDNRPELRALRHAVNAYEAKVKIQRSNFVPDLAFVISLRGGYTPGVRIQQNTNPDRTTAPQYEETNAPFVYENSYNYGSFVPGMALVMSYPLDFGKNSNNLKQVKAELTALVLDKKWAINGIMLEVETAYIDVTSTKASIDALQRSKRLARGWMLAAVQNNATGIGKSKEVKDALKEYFGIMAQIHQKIATYNIAIAKLDQATGVRMQLKKK